MSHPKSPAPKPPDELPIRVDPDAPLEDQLATQAESRAAEKILRQFREQQASQQQQ